MAQADSCQQIVKHVTSKCTQCPPEVRSTIVELQVLEGRKQEPQPRIKYGSRKIFFQRVWTRVHGNDDDDDDKPAADKKEKDNEAGAEEEVPWERIIGNSPVVTLEDRGLIAEAQLAAIAQMDLCQLTEADRIGWFKNREIGFGGLACKYCGGRPSFGRYFPNSVRSFVSSFVRSVVTSLCVIDSLLILSHLCLPYVFFDRPKLPVVRQSFHTFACTAKSAPRTFAIGS